MDLMVYKSIMDASGSFVALGFISLMASCSVGQIGGSW
jgi:hypothetical protein